MSEEISIETLGNRTADVPDAHKFEVLAEDSVMPIQPGTAWEAGSEEARVARGECPPRDTSADRLRIAADVDWYVKHVGAITQCPPGHTAVPSFVWRRGELVTGLSRAEFLRRESDRKNTRISEESER